MKRIPRAALLYLLLGAAVLFGPNTVGGVIDVISRAPSLRPVAVVLDARLDSNPDALGNVFVSGTQGGLSYGIEYLRKGGEGFRDSLEYSIDDLDLELGYVFNEDHSARAHFQFYDERSETPGGLLPDQYASDVTISNKPNDEFFGQRIEGDVRNVVGPRHELRDVARPREAVRAHVGAEVDVDVAAQGQDAPVLCARDLDVARVELLAGQCLFLLGSAVAASARLQVGIELLTDLRSPQPALAIAYELLAISLVEGEQPDHALRIAQKLIAAPGT